MGAFIVWEYNENSAKLRRRIDLANEIKWVAPPNHFLHGATSEYIDLDLETSSWAYPSWTIATRIKQLSLLEGRTKDPIFTQNRRESKKLRLD